MVGRLQLWLYAATQADVDGLVTNLLKDLKSNQITKTFTPSRSDVMPDGRFVALSDVGFTSPANMTLAQQFITTNWAPGGTYAAALPGSRIVIHTCPDPGDVPCYSIGDYSEIIK